MSHVRFSRIPDLSRGRKGLTLFLRPGAFPVLLLLLLPLAGCHTVASLPPSRKGGLLNPVKADGPEGERHYLNRLRRPDGKRVRYRYEKPVPGPEGSVLDRFLLDAKGVSVCPLSPLEMVADQLRSEPRCPLYYRIYMNMYHPHTSDDEAPPGYRLLVAPGPATIPKK